MLAPTMGHLYSHKNVLLTNHIYKNHGALTTTHKIRKCVVARSEHVLILPQYPMEGNIGVKSSHMEEELGGGHEREVIIIQANRFWSLLVL